MRTGRFAIMFVDIETMKSILLGETKIANIPDSAEIVDMNYVFHRNSLGIKLEGDFPETPPGGEFYQLKCLLKPTE